MCARRYEIKLTAYDIFLIDSFNTFSSYSINELPMSAKTIWTSYNYIKL